MHVPSPATRPRVAFVSMTKGPRGRAPPGVPFHRLDLEQQVDKHGRRTCRVGDWAALQVAGGSAGARVLDFPCVARVCDQGPGEGCGSQAPYNYRDRYSVCRAGASARKLDAGGVFSDFGFRSLGV